MSVLDEQSGPDDVRDFIEQNKRVRDQSRMALT